MLAVLRSACDLADAPLSQRLALVLMVLALTMVSVAIAYQTGRQRGRREH